MGLVLKIAWRNILRHKGKSLVVGIILLLGAFVLTMGNAFLSGMEKGIERNFVNKFSGDIVIYPTNQPPDDALIGVMMQTPKTINCYTNIASILNSRKDIADYTPICRGMAMALSEDGDPGMTMVMGVKFEDYQRMFGTNILLLEGRPLKPLERGLMITSNSRLQLYEFTSYWLKPEGCKLNTNNISASIRSNLVELLVRTNIVVMGMDEAGMALDIRVPIKGIFKYSQFNTVWKEVSMMDIESFRECFNYYSGADAESGSAKDPRSLLNATSEKIEDMFGDDMITAVDTSGSAYDLVQLKTKSAGPAVPANIDAGTYNLVLVRVKAGADSAKSLKSINAALKSAGLPVRATTWLIAVKRVSQMVDFIRIVLYGFVGILYVVAMIIIMNTLSMSALERTTEIGMMRAVGARKGFIQNMFVGETAILSAFFGGLGIVLGMLTSTILTSFHFKAGNEWLELLYGGNVFSPSLGIMDLLGSILFLSVATALALIYPVMVARRITPLEAIARD